jgi:hypothetical protein
MTHTTDREGLWGMAGIGIGLFVATLFTSRYPEMVIYSCLGILITFFGIVIYLDKYEPD